MDDPLLISLVECETRVWEALVAGDQVADAAALHPAFLGVYADGFARKSDHVAQLGQGPTVQSYQLTDCRVMELGTDHALLSYRADFLRCGQSVPETMFVSSIWKRRARDWVNVFSQDTVAEV
ncbi:nuclear transport factor 2 family protein [Pseudorhodobacter sp.]|uniref:nuclear transport factor 2 family protein n=1 Tax=Pseudorhodobacter sp. TaxID=1934400 RepID=UPI0026495E8E|nr:nuclear transport factor 2 family protein [Pseudorhodobacter sp.]MDN5788116.1 nuclear transport factor 2 family protein [Pseudorhodobacter sp.]